MAVRFDEVIERLASRDARRGVAPGPSDSNVVRRDDVAAVASRFQSLLLHSDDLDRGECLSSEQLRAYVDEVQAQRAQVRIANARGDYESMSDEARGFLQAENLTIDEGSETWRRLLKATTQAQLNALRDIMKRLDGEPVPTPDAHPAIRGLGDIDHIDGAVDHWIKKTRPRPKTIIEACSLPSRLKTFRGKCRIGALTRDEYVSFQASEAAPRVGKRQIRPQTVNKMLGLVNAIFNLAFNDILLSRGIENKLTGVEKEKVKPSDRIYRLDFSQEQLSALFSGPVHTRGFRPVGGAGEACFWLPILGHTTGARMTEVGQLARRTQAVDVALREVSCFKAPRLPQPPPLQRRKRSP